MLQEETQKLRQQMLTRSASVQGGDNSSPEVSADLTATHGSNSSRGSSTRTDSTESGIDMRSEIGGGPSSPQYKLKLHSDQDNNLSEEEKECNSHTVVEVHQGGSSVECPLSQQQHHESEVIEMCEINGGYVDDEDIEISA